MIFGERGRISVNPAFRIDFLSATIRKGPMEKLVTGVAEFKVAGAEAHLPPVMGLCNNEIVAWSVAGSANMAQAMEMLDRLDAYIVYWNTGGTRRA